MYDFPNNAHIQSIVRKMHQSGKVIGAVCHGPAALVHATKKDGHSILEDKSISSFTNQEELFLIPDAEDVFPFLLEDKLIESGANFQEGTMYLENVVEDGQLVTGQNPWSTWKLAETMVRKMGIEPKKRTITPDEHAVQVLSRFETKGYGSAEELITELADNQREMNRTLLAMHSIIAAMQWKVGKSLQLVWLVRHAKSVSTN